MSLLPTLQGCGIKIANSLPHGLNFDEDGVEQNRQERVVLEDIFSVHRFLVLSITSFEYARIFWGTAITNDLRKYTRNIFHIFLS